MQKSKKITSLPIISLSDGQQIGRVRGLAVDPVAMVIVALILDHKGLFKEPRVIPYERVCSIGSHAITVDKATSAEKLANVPQIVPLVKNPTPLVGNKVITDTGNILGSLDDYLFEVATGKIIKLIISGKLTQNFFKGPTILDTGFVVTAGKETIIVRNGAEQERYRQNNTLHETVKTAKDTGARILSSTLKTTKKIGGAFDKTLKNGFNKTPKEDNHLLSKNKNKVPPPATEAPASPPPEPKPPAG